MRLSTAGSTLIRNAEINGQWADVQVCDGRIHAIGPPGQGRCAYDGDALSVDARGGALLPGLHDHHIHLFALAAARASIACGPPDVLDAESLRERLRAAAAGSHEGWLRGVGYHESVAGDLDRDWLDATLPGRPVRIQHRSGRLWILNSAALARLPRSSGSPLERLAGRPTGRLYDADSWLRQQLAGQYPDVTDICRELASCGITAFTDASVSNGRTTYEYLGGQTQAGAIRQTVQVMGDASLSGLPAHAGVSVGPFKVHLHEHALPDLQLTVRAVADAHAAGRVAAFHCVTRTELVYALAVLDEAGRLPGDRIEHAASVSTDLLPAVAERQLTVVTQPLFVRERGDQYRRDIPPAEQEWLYRCAAWRHAGVTLAGSSDAPYGNCNPWLAMQAAVDRRTADGYPLGAAEALSPEAALELYLSPLDAPGRAARTLRSGAPADLCLLDRPWRAARRDLSVVKVRATFCRGQFVYRQETP
jgi:predicted amidohydrolase YtcJ